jgi:hypothetical protein
MSSEHFLCSWFISSSAFKSHICAIEDNEGAGEQRIIATVSGVTVKLTDRCNQRKKRCTEDRASSFLIFPVVMEGA